MKESTRTVQEKFIVKDKRTGKYKIKSTGFSSNMWTDDIKKAMLFKTTGAVKRGMYCYNTNPDRRKIGAKIILPDWVEIIPVKINLTIG